MKKITIFLVVLLACFSYSLKAQKSPKKIALIVAIADYPKEGGWSDISSDKDVPLIEKSLRSQGFTDITILRDADATKEGIIAAIEDLTNKASKGDIVVFHYSGHGQQVKDDNNDEKSDGYDEALVAYDAQMRFRPGVYEGENHLRDDDLDKLFFNLRKKIGSKGNLLVILDACHSGTGTRGLAKARGTMEKMAPKDYEPETSGEEIGMVDNSNNSRGAGADLGSMIILSGASPDELNYETEDDNGNSVGSLSFAFSRAIAKSDKNTTYRAFFDMIKVDMMVLAPNQQPMVEGNIDAKLFAGDIVKQKPYFTIEKWLGDNTVEINAGTVFAIFEGSEVTFYPIGTTDPKKAKAITKGTIIKSDFYTAQVKLEEEMSEEVIKNSWAFITNQNLGDVSVKVKVDVNNEDLKNIVLKIIDEEKNVVLDNKNPDVLIEQGNAFSRGSKLHIITTSEYLIYENSFNSSNEDKMAEEIQFSLKAFAQGKYLRNLDMESSYLDVKFEFIPVKVDKNENEIERYDISEKIDKSTTIVFKEGDYFKLRITNNGKVRAYYSIIDIQPDNIVNLLVPAYDYARNIRIPASEFYVEPGKTIELDYVFYFGPPHGKEVFKLIASEQPLNLEPIILTRGAGMRGDEGPFEKLMSNSYTGSRGAGQGRTGAQVPAEMYNIYSIVFKIDKK